MLREERVKPPTKQEARYKPKVWITILINPKVRKVTGNNNIFMIGFKTSSKIAKINATETIVWIRGLKERL